jgi:ribosome modulation factor
MKAYGGVDVQIHVLTSALVGGKWSASRLCRFTPGERAPRSHWIGGWVDPRANLDDMAKLKFLTPPGLELRPSDVQPVASLYIDCATAPV